MHTGRVRACGLVRAVLSSHAQRVRLANVRAHHHAEVRQKSAHQQMRRFKQRGHFAQHCHILLFIESEARAAHLISVTSQLRTSERWWVGVWGGVGAYST